MRNAARILGIIWMVGAILVAIVLLGSGLVRGNRGEIFLLFTLALPGILIFRWGRNFSEKKPIRVEPLPRRKAPVDMAAEDGHVTQLDETPHIDLERPNRL
jgi:hypothetical protein